MSVHVLSIESTVYQVVVLQKGSATVDAFVAAGNLVAEVRLDSLHLSDFVCMQCGVFHMAEQYIRPVVTL